MSEGNEKSEECIYSVPQTSQYGGKNSLQSLIYAFSHSQ
jgi:hypothetical protein